MSSTYLPADVRTRIIDLMKEHKFSQKKLALSIGVHESTLGRFLNGTTEKLSEESVIRIAKTFNVSTDFILGTTQIPDKKNYDISELGKADIVNRLLENPRFATVTYMIAGYLDDTTAGGYAAHNQMIATVTSMLLGQNKTSAVVMAAREANSYKVPVYQADLTNIQNTFMTAVREVKKEVGSELEAQKALSKEITAEMFATLTKGQDAPVPTVTPEEVADAITGTIANVDGVNQKALDDFNNALVGLMQTMVIPNDKPDE